MYDGPIQDLIDELGRLPGIGPTSAQRIAFHLLNAPRSEADRLTDAVTNAKERIGRCRICWNISESDPCRLCTDTSRQTGVLCVVEEPKDVVALNKAGFSGRYHVLGGALSPTAGIGAEQLRFRELLSRIDQEQIEELIVCTNPNIEGDITALFLARQMEPLGLKVTRLASGLPVGSDLEHADEQTLESALKHRQVL